MLARKPAPQLFPTVIFSHFPTLIRIPVPCIPTKSTPRNSKEAPKRPWNEKHHSIPHLYILTPNHLPQRKIPDKCPSHSHTFSISTRGGQEVPENRDPQNIWQDVPTHPSTLTNSQPLFSGTSPAPRARKYQTMLPPRTEKKRELSLSLFLCFFLSFFLPSFLPSLPPTPITPGRGS